MIVNRTEDVNNNMRTNNPGYSVLMSVYYKEKPEWLEMAMDSIWNQTVRTDNFVLVCDGPLNQALDDVIERMGKEHPELKVVRLEKNGGLGNALNIGMKYCEHDLIARMDSDDISRNDRIEKQLGILNSDRNVSICSGVIEEFSDNPEKVKARRLVPEKQDEILMFAKKRNPFNHPCVMYRRSSVEASGGYQDFYLLEDYYLWIRMLQIGAKGYNIQEPLLWMRAGSDMYKRRAGLRYARSQKALFKYMKKTGFICNSQYFTSVSTRYVSSLVPNCIRRFFYMSALRNRK